MGKRRLVRVALSGLILVTGAAGLSAQTWPSRFRLHSYNISAGGFGGYNTVSSPRATIPFSVVRSDGTMTGTIQLRYPDSLPDGTVHTRTDEVGPYLVLSSPVTVGFHLEFDYIANAVTPPQTISSGLRLEISSGHTLNENSPCRAVRPERVHQSGTTTHISDDLECTFSRMIISGVSGGNAPDSVIVVGNFIDFTTAFSTCGICGFLGTVYTEYRTYSPLDLTVSRIEVVQAVQDIGNSVPLVAEKRTVARVFLGIGSETSAITPPFVLPTLRAFDIAGAELPGTPQTIRTGVRAVNRPNREATDDSMNFELPTEWTVPGTIKLRAEVNTDGSVAETDRTNNTREVSVSFQARLPLDVRWIKICYPTADKCPTSWVESMGEKMRLIFPVGQDHLEYHRLKIPDWFWPSTFPPLEGGGKEGERALQGARAKNALLGSLRRQYELSSDGSLDQLVGWLPEIPEFSIAGASDPMWLGRTGRVSFVQEIFGDSHPNMSQSTAGALLAHEVGHNLGLRHTNTPDCGGCEDPDSDWPDPASGRIHEVGFDPESTEAMPASKFDVMTYRNNPGSNIWISPFHFRKLFDGYLQPRAGRVPQSAAEETYAVVSGRVRHDATSATLDPVVVVRSSVPPEPPSPDGNYCIRITGGTAPDYCFALSFHLHPGDEEAEEELFVLRVPFPDGATRVSLRRGETELAARTASPNAPTVTITSPAAGDVWEGTRSIRWQGSDPDGDPLTYTVLYSADGGEKWLAIATDTSTTEYAFDTALIRSGSQIQFRVLASDGLRTGTATVGPLTVVPAPVVGVPSGRDFGSVKLGAFRELALPLANLGEKALTVRAIRSSLGDFTLRDAAPLVVAPDGRRDLALKFAPAAEGVRVATLSFESDDPAHPVVTATLVGAGLAEPQISLTPGSLAFGDVAVGASRELTVRIRNTGKGTLTVLALGSNSSQFVVRQPAAPLSIAEGAEASTIVAFRPQAGGAQSAALVITSTAAASPLLSVPLSGTGTGAAAGCPLSVSPASFSLPVQGGNRSVGVTAPPGCAWTAVPGAEWVTVASGESGAGNGTVSFSAGPNSGRPRSAELTLGGAAVVVFQDGGAESFVVPAVASTPGALGSFFKTGIQLHNPGPAPISGHVTYHAAGVSASPEDPGLEYRIEPGATKAFGDLLPAFQQSGLGSVDLEPRTGAAPVATIRIFNDAGEAGTTGMTEELVRPGEALEAGQRGVLIAPPEPSRARFNIGVRSLSFGATIRFAVRDATGVVRTTGAKFYPPSYFAQQTAESLLGIALLANDTISFEVDAGSAIVYGATTDNTTQDPSLQFARTLTSRSDPRRAIAAVAAAPGVLDSLFRTTLQLHNPTAAPISGRLVFHPGGFSGTDSDPSLPYALAPGATTSYADILGALGRTGLGSLDIVATTGSAPLAVARVFNDGGVRGTTGFSVDGARPEDALQSGETGVLLAPADPAAARFNVGIRTFDAGASLSVTIRNRDGQSIRTFTRIYAPNYFEQQGGSVFLGAAPGPSDSVSITVTAGSAIVYGASTDNRTQDPAMQVARAIR
jgi:hypothetical protein